MISKSVIIFWSVACLTIFVHLVGKDGGATAFYILAMGLMWAIVVVPTALIGRLFKSQKVYSTNMQLLRGGVLTAVGLIAFVIVHASQQTSVTKAQNNPPKEKVTMQSPAPVVLRNGFTQTDISAMVTTYRQNEARFRHEYVGRLFSARMRLSRVSENVIGETARVDFGSVYCNLPRGSNRAIAWDKGDEIEMSGIIKDVWFGSVELERCSFR